MVANTPIEIVILSVNETLAKDIIFGYCMNFCQNSEFFRRKEYSPNLDVKSKLMFPKNISIIPLSGAKTAGISRNVIFAVMDEASWYTVTSQGDKAQIQYTNLMRRIKSRFEKFGLPNEVLKGMLLAVSSPCHEEDWLEGQFKKRKDEATVYLKRVTSISTKPLGTFGPRSFSFCCTCRKVVDQTHIRHGIDIVIPNKHERKEK